MHACMQSDLSNYGTVQQLATNQSNNYGTVLVLVPVYVQLPNRTEPNIYVTSDLNRQPNNSRISDAGQSFSTTKQHRTAQRTIHKYILVYTYKKQRSEARKQINKEQ
mmetsp:Transcript_23804/g.52075  ORF Transcript_23804/g.52075 Transcript_23804/m.52075 type:complete len:107 (-) Transcript_23804:1963-2283(-)